MIRVFEPGDARTIDEMLERPDGHVLTWPAEGRVERIARDFAGADATQVRTLVWDDGAVRGFARLEVSSQISQVFLFVNPARRGQGVGAALWDEAMRALAEVDPATTWVFYRADAGHSRAFYLARGCQVWYGYHHMQYRGPAFPGSGLEVCPYEDSLWDAYFTQFRAAFMDLNTQIDGGPPDPVQQQEQVRRRLAENGENTYLYFDGDCFVGSAVIYDGKLLDEVFVCRELQGRGYGRRIVQDTCNRVIAAGLFPELACVTTNAVAKHLYDGVGFETLQTLEMARRFSPNKAPDLRAPG